MSIRRADSADGRDLAHMAADLLADEHYDFPGEEVFVWEGSDGRIGAFLSLSIRPWSEGAGSMPVPHVEAWYVKPSLRRRGIGTALMSAAEAWCREADFSELCSDVETCNRVSMAAHRHLGFAPTLRLQYFRKSLGQAA